MPEFTNGRHLVKEYPSGYPIPGRTTAYDTSAKINTDSVSLNGGILAKLLLISVDPYLRGRLAGYTPSKFALEEPLAGYGIVKVIRSENDKFHPGDILYGNGRIRHEEYSIITKEEAEHVVAFKPVDGIPLSVYIGAAGMPGLTAFTGLKEYGNVKKGETIFVSTAAGAVGSMVVQIAKKEGLKVIGSAGSEEKVKFLKELGVDVAFNYKTTDTREVLQKEGPIDIYWDNVGGDTLDAVLENTNEHARVIMCGAISGYNGEPAIVKNLMYTIYKQTKLYGHLVGPLLSKYQEAFDKDVIPKLADGTYKHRCQSTFLHLQRSWPRRIPASSWTNSPLYQAL